VTLTPTNLIEEAQLNEARLYSRQIKVNPYTALLDEVQWRAGHVASIREVLSNQDQTELFTETAFGNQEYSILLKRYDTERRFLDNACKLAIQAGVSEKYVRLAELQGQLIFQVLRTALEDPTVGLSIEQKEALILSMNNSLQTSVPIEVIEANSI
jgi:hypothetical protein